ncbi:MAG: glycoside hydrolase family 2 protein [Bacteroidales bacterium]|nr:glycoside hydrolase family 2 protein [Bacteroidales bacterium]
MNINKNWYFHETGDSAWYKAEVPGSVHTDLLRNKIIEPPFYRLNEHDQQWIDKKDWEYKTTFNVNNHLLAKERIELVCKGLDTYADVYLNDSLLVSSNNMFREWKAEIKSLLRKGENNITILFHSPVNKGLEAFDNLNYVIPVSNNDQSELGGLGDKKVSIFTRKAGYHYGWDWGPRFVTSGIWRPIYVQAWNKVHIENIQYIQKDVNRQNALVTAIFEVYSTSQQEIEFSISEFGKKDFIVSKKVSLEQGKNIVELSFEIKNPKLWWTNGLGEPYLYNFIGSAKLGGVTLQELYNKIGIRKLRIITKPDNDGKTFYVELNDVPIFMKGANYIPNDNFLTRVTPEKYTNIVKSAADANMNMLRVWGGGIYENDIFYNLCDQYGILVWQDFMFACAMYPGDQAFLENVRQEAIDNVVRLRNHPSIALWCGNNEILGAWWQWGWKEAEEKKSKENADKIWLAYLHIFDSILPGVVNQYDSDRFYWESSPQADRNIPSTLKANSGDMHNWNVWHGGDEFDSYNEVIPRFMSEFGFQSFPELKTVNSYTLPEDRDIESEVMQSHQRHPRGNQLIKTYMARHYIVPKDFEQFLYVGQLLQAEGVRIGIEAHRRNMPYCMGSLYWQLNDCWPVASWSGIDYYGRWKALHYFAREAFSQVMLSGEITNNKFNLYVVSDRLEHFDCILDAKIINFTGEILKQEEIRFTVASNSSNIYFQKYLSEWLDGINRNNVFLNITLNEDEKMLASTNVYFKPLKNLSFPHSDIKVEVAKNESGFAITLATDNLSKNVFLSTLEADGLFSDNFFDMLPGEEKTILFITENKDVDLKKQLRVMSLNNI